MKQVHIAVELTFTVILWLLVLFFGIYLVGGCL